MKYFAIALLCVSMTSVASAACHFVKRTAKTELKDKMPPGTMVEKKSLDKLAELLPNEGIKEKVYSGEIALCTECAGQFVTCD